MRIKLTYVTSLLAAGAAAIAIVAAPTAAALPKTCVGNGAGTTCRVARQRRDHQLRSRRQFLSLRDHAVSARRPLKGNAMTTSRRRRHRRSRPQLAHLFRRCIRCPRVVAWYHYWLTPATPLAQ